MNRTATRIDPSLIVVNGLTVGQVCPDESGDMTLHKWVQSKNFLKVAKAWAVANDHISLARKYDAVNIVLIDEHGTRYQTSMRTFEEHSEPMPDYGYGKQRSLSILHWQRSIPRPDGQTEFNFEGV